MAGTSASGSSAAGQKDDSRKTSRPRSPIGAEVTLGDTYYKTYTEERTFPPGEVYRQRVRNPEGLYRAFIVGEANNSAASYQIVRDWRQMHRERASWEKYRERLSAEAREFEQMKAKFLEEKSSFKKREKI
ncbi:hypothetical protein Hanom_Chr15g01411301 [Helianthus anomalus]